MMDKRKQAGLLTLPYHLLPGPVGVPGPLPRLPLRDPFRVSLRLDAACWEREQGGCAPRRPYSPLPLDGAFEPAFLRKRNERERQRVRCVNEGYARLRAHLPRELADKRLSKVETLRAAIRYIKHLQELLERHARGQEGAAGAGPSLRAECNSDGESKASSAPSPSSEPEEGAC
ncbi:achaete-scute homolog 4 [Neophocaena asiaeorientalis asiaeorientalis]|uniref:Achaete-scute homolog 4 n=1 Tax=Neophocaena asiaeorientalis asiaeorientalis TaxID=1706337 RepID=A0A341ABB1_NEOAA|nr:achaete-scute homolog 4 [Neophocaena asiaeorientalis asiaeorientalis]